MLNDIKNLIEQLFSGVSIEIIDDKIIISENKIKEEFVEFIKSIPDSIFAEVMNLFSKAYDLLEVNKDFDEGKISQKMFDDLKDITKEVAQIRIAELEKFI